MKKLFGLLCLSMLVVSMVRAQKAVDYASFASGQAVIFHGKEQLKYSPSIKNHPYLKSDKYAAGNLSFEGILYEDVKMRLDLYKNELLLLSPDDRYNLVLPSDRVDFAQLHGYHIIYHDPEGKENSLPEGYYLRLHDGRCTVLEKSSCAFSKKIKGLEVEESFDQSVKYYIQKEGAYYPVGSKGSVLRVFKESKKELARYIKQEKLDFRHAREKAIVAVAREYERLNENR